MRSVGVDTGGTFTDITYIAPDGTIETLKTPTSSDLRSGIERGLRGMADEVEVAADAIEHLAHGSTVAVNTLIERTGADTALVTTAGFRDRLEIGELYRSTDLLYDPSTQPTESFVPRQRRFEVDERLGPDGTVQIALDDDDIGEAVEAVRDSEADAVAVSCLFAYRNDEHERQLASALRERTDCTVTRASALSNEIDEYERTATAVADAYVKPRVTAYLEALRDDLQAWGLTVPIHVMKSDGGLARDEVVQERPITQLISGPIAGVTAAQYYGRQRGLENQITFDMGGTSCDASLIVDGEPTESATRTVADLDIKGPFTTIETVGAGGGSIAWVDDAGSLHVGPRSAGADPGPACYGRGGTEPTVTDANLLLGLLDLEAFAGGTIDIDRTAAERAIERVADPLGLSPVEAALAIRDIVNSKMAGTTRVVSVEQGFDPREFTLTAFGGAGPMHAVDIHREMGTRDVLVPNRAGLASSLGLLLADIRHNSVQSVVELVPDIDAEELSATFEAIEADVRGVLEDDEVPSTQRTLSWTVDVRYEGQSHYLNLPVERPFDEQALTALADEFDAEHRRVYGFVDENATVEVVNARVTAIGEIAHPDLAVPDTERSGSLADVATQRTVVIRGKEEVTADQYTWPDVVPGDTLTGPALVAQANSTVWLPAGYEGSVDDYKNIHITDIDQ